MPGFTQLHLIQRFVRIITFRDLPINRKFFLFSLGVLFWFLLMGGVAAFALFTINHKYDRIVHQTIPHERVAQKISRNLRAIMSEVSEALSAHDQAEVQRHNERAQAYLEDIRAFSAALALGGEVNDFSRDTNRVVESFVTTSVNDDEQGVFFLRALGQQTESIGKSLGEFMAGRSHRLAGEGDDEGLAALVRLKAALSRGNELAIEFSAHSADRYVRYNEEIQDAIATAALTMLGVLLIALVLLGIFTHWIADAISLPIRSIISQIRSLGTGDIDLTKKITISSKDEIGTLSAEFNGLMETVYGMTMFKNVIEEDTNLGDVYVRLGEVFEREAGIADFRIYEVHDNQREMRAVYPLLQETALRCSAEILGNCELCRARKTGHNISSLTYPEVCLQFRPETPEQQHICVPLNIGGRIGGVVQFLFRPEAGGSLDSHQVQAAMFKAEAYIKQSLSVLEAKRLLNTLRESALKDPLTGLYNRRFLQDHAQVIIAGVKRRQKLIGMLMCDLDYFKQVNDQYGHEIGDHVLTETSAIIVRSIRESDYVIRFGGEEFLVLLLDLTSGEAELIAEKIRAGIAQAKIATQSGAISKTISIGVSEFSADTDAFWQAIKFADVALYRAKEEGRNRVVRFRPEMWHGDQF